MAPKGQETRPTSDRVREALFSMLASDGAFEQVPQPPRVLDLYAGSGALGLEALSRGAREAVFVESARSALTAIRENIDALGVGPETQVLAMKVERGVELALGATGQPFDLILVDPPYAEVRGRGFAALLEKSARLLAASGIFVLEHASSDPPPESEGLVLDRQRRHGDTSLSLYRARFRILPADSG